MVDILIKLKKQVKDDRSAKDTLNTVYKDLSEKIEHLELLLSKAEKARIILQTVAQKTLQNLEFRISNLGTLAMKSVDPDFPELVVNISVRRNQTEVDFWFKEKEQLQKPDGSSGYGAIDIACYGLRVSFWALDKTRNVMLLDEPFRDLSPDRQSKASEMVKMLSQKYSLQHVIVSHAEDLDFSADRTFYMDKIKGASKVTVN